MRRVLLLVSVFALAACGRGRSEPSAARRESASNVERTDTNRGRSAERARSDVAKEAENTEQERVRTTEAERQRSSGELHEEVKDLQATADRACAGVPEQSRTTCPFRWNEATEAAYTRDGVVFKLPASRGPASEVAREFDCRRARAALDAARAPEIARVSDTELFDPAQCVLDIPDVDARVFSENGRTEVELRSRNGRHLDQIRQLARAGIGVRNTPEGERTVRRTAERGARTGPATRPSHP